jgi:soluble lytic murein transglycosylase
MSIVSLKQHMDLRSAAGSGVAPAREQQLAMAAEQFEALFLQQILKQMRKASDVLGAGNPMRSRELDTMRDLYDEVLAETLANKRQVGLADMLVRQLSGDGQALELERASEQARLAALPARSPSQSEPLRSTWQRGMDTLGGWWDQGSAGFRRLVGGVIEQESGGQLAAVSPKGARGLMQLMPDTARDMAGELGLPFDEQRLLSDGDYNKRLGSAYLGKMLQRYDGHQALALAAYNAGPGRVDEWLERHGDPRQGSISSGQWIERIPFQETRDYTRNILGKLAAADVAPSIPARGAASLRLVSGMSVAGALNGEAATVVMDTAERPQDQAAHHQSRSAAFAAPIRLEPSL